MKRKLFLIFITTVILVAAIWLWLSDLDRIALIDTHGQKSSGTLAGVRVGQSSQDAVYNLKNLGMRSANYADDGSCPLRGRFDQIIVFIDVSWRKGTICIGIIQGKVSSVAWRYNFFQP